MIPKSRNKSENCGGGLRELDKTCLVKKKSYIACPSCLHKTVWWRWQQPGKEKVLIIRNFWDVFSTFVFNIQRMGSASISPIELLEHESSEETSTWVQIKWAVKNHTGISSRTSQQVHHQENYTLSLESSSSSPLLFLLVWPQLFPMTTFLWGVVTACIFIIAYK